MNLSDLNPLAAIGGKLIDRFLPDPAAAAAAKQELAQMQENGELARMANETRLVELTNANTDSARKRELEIATSASAPWYSKIVTPLLALGVFVLWAAINLTMLTKAVPIPSEMREIVIRMLGSLDAATMLILSYYFGQSHKH